MNYSRTLSLLALLVLSSVFVDPAVAALSPEKIARMKDAATDVLVIEVVEVTVADPEAVQSQTIITAKISAVQRSERRVMIGEQIEIESYRIADFSQEKLKTEQEIKEGLEALLLRLGPKSPPTIGQGWTGKVYLKSQGVKGQHNRYGLAAFGHSFEEK